jgi:hypothetical protein
MKQVDQQIEELKKLTNTAKNVDLAKVLGISPKTIQSWKGRDKIPEDIFIKAREISQRGGVVAPRGYLELKFYDVEVSAGSGALVEKEEESTAMVFSEKFLRQDLGYNPANVFLMPVRGDSMSPTLKNQSIVMVNRVDGFSTDGIYVFRYDGRLMVKRLQFLPNGIKVVSDNTAYEPWELGKEEIKSADFEIIGEVVWSGQRM